MKKKDSSEHMPEIIGLVLGILYAIGFMKYRAQLNIGMVFCFKILVIWFIVTLGCSLWELMLKKIGLRKESKTLVTRIITFILNHIWQVVFAIIIYGAMILIIYNYHNSNYGGIMSDICIILMCIYGIMFTRKLRLDNYDNFKNRKKIDIE